MAVIIWKFGWRVGPNIATASSVSSYIHSEARVDTSITVAPRVKTHIYVRPRVATKLRLWQKGE